RSVVEERELRLGGVDVGGARGADRLLEPVVEARQLRPGGDDLAARDRHRGDASGDLESEVPLVELDDALVARRHRVPAVARRHRERRPQPREVFYHTYKNKCREGTASRGIV